MCGWETSLKHFHGTIKHICFIKETDVIIVKIPNKFNTKNAWESLFYMSISYKKTNTNIWKIPSYKTYFWTHHYHYLCQFFKC